MLRPASTREILLVLGIPIALSLASAVMWRLRRPGSMVFTDRNVLLSMAIQAILAACLLPYLYRRQWRPIAVAGIPEVLDFARGIGLWLGLVGFFYLTLLVLYTLAPNFVAPLQKSPFTGTMSPPVIVVAAIFDPIVEEFLWLGYAIPALGNRFGIRVAYLGSVGVRVAAHAYQGRLAIIAILPVAVVLTWYYVRTGRLWPVVVAHVIQDAIAISIMVATT